MSVLVPPLTNHHHHNHHHPPTYFSNNPTRRINGNSSSSSQTTKSNRLSLNKCNENDQNKDHVPHGVVNSMKQRLLNKVNESFLFNQNSTLARHSLSKPSSRLSSNENLLQTKPSLLSPLKRATRLSRSQDNLITNNNQQQQQSIANQALITEQFTSYIQPKQEVIIIDATSNDEEDEILLQSGPKTSTHRQSYTELHVDEAPKPGTVTTVKNMFERQIRLSRYDADKLFNSSTPGSSRMSSQHREISSPTARSRSISPNDILCRQRRTILSASTLPAPTISLPVPTSYPDVVISHTPPAESTKPSNEQIHNDNLLINNQSITKDKKIFHSNRNSISHEQSPLCVIVDESSSNVSNHQRPNLLLPSVSTSSSTSSSSETVDCQPLDFKSRLALFNRTNTQQSNENSLNIKKPINPINILPTKPVVHQSTRSNNEEMKNNLSEIIPNPLSISISRSVVNTAKAVTFFGGDKLNGTTKSSLPKSIAPPPPPVLSQKHEQSSSSIELLRSPDIVGGNIKLNKSSIFSGAKKDARVQFIDNVDTFEYPSFEVAMAELGSTGSDDDNNAGDDDDRSSTSSNEDNQKNHINGKLNVKQEESTDNNNQVDDVDDDELERLARINAEFNTNNLSEKPLKPKGTLHTFRPTHLDQYELGTQHGSFPISKSSDISTSKNSYTILARQKLLDASDNSTKNVLFKQQKTHFDNIQWSSMSTSTDLLF